MCFFLGQSDSVVSPIYLRGGEGAEKFSGAFLIYMLGMRLFGGQSSRKNLFWMSKIRIMIVTEI